MLPNFIGYASLLSGISRFVAAELTALVLVVLSRNQHALPGAQRQAVRAREYYTRDGRAQTWRVRPQSAALQGTVSRTAPEMSEQLRSEQADKQRRGG